MSLVDNVDALAFRVSDEFNIVRGEMGSVDYVAPGLVVTTGDTTRPTTRTDITVFFVGDDPGSNACDGDYWIGG